MQCYDVEKKGFCPRKFCKWCPDKPTPTPGKGKGKGGGGYMNVWQPQFQKQSWGGGWGKGGSWGKGKGKGKSKSVICEDMKKTGACPRGEACKWCKLMIEKYGTNDWSDPTCWNVTKFGQCKQKFCKWCPEKPDPLPKGTY